MGTIITQKRDLTGTLYRRNRYYDPGTGRFTQEDPIGVAGGMNLYGYAGGDPVNRRRTPVGTSCGRKFPSGSRGISSGTAPVSVSTVFGVVPFR